MRTEADIHSVQLTSEYLRLLLQRDGPYRRRWEREAARIRPGQINVDAVARVLSHHRELERPEGSYYRELSDTVSRALKGRVLTLATLREFVEAFDMSADDAHRLLEIACGHASTVVVEGDAVAPPGLYGPTGRPGYQTIALHDIHDLGANGLPWRHRTIQTIRATEDNVSAYTYRFDTSAVQISVERGGLPGPIRALGDELYAVDIVFHRPLMLDETATFEFVTTFDYSAPPPPAFRRCAYSRVDTLVIEVCFHPEAVPSRLWWAEWNSLDHHDIRRQREVRLNEDHCVHCQHDQVVRSIVGFHWQWDTLSASG